MSRPQSQFTRMLFESPLVKLAKFRASPSHAGFRDSGPTRQHCFVFPRTSVRIRHAGEKPFMANPNVITLYNQEQVYTRETVTSEGDRCDWFAVEPGVLAELMAAYDPAVGDDPEHPFRLPFVPGDPKTYLLQRLVVRHVTESERADPLFVEETVLHVLAQIAAGAARSRGVAPRSDVKAGTLAAEVVDAVLAILGQRFRESLSLAELARRSGYSAFHLSRIFRKRSGLSLHAWQSRLRLLTALERVAERGADVAEVALDLGYSSHSHFTAAFRAAFGITPSAFRTKATPERVREMAGRCRGGSARRGRGPTPRGRSSGAA
jgi:AraC family transcriptional regulator